MTKPKGTYVQKPPAKKLFVVTAYRWGDRENHSYTIGVFDSADIAMNAAESERDDRGGKYSVFVEEFELNKIDEECGNIIFKAKGIEP